MSILLDALKKSEQQRRQLAGTDALRAAERASPAPAQSRPWTLLALAVLAAAVLAALLWRYVGPPGALPDDGAGATADAPTERAVPAPSTAESAIAPAASKPKTLVAELPAGSNEDSGATGGKASAEDQAQLSRSFNEYRAEAPEVRASQSGTQTAEVKTEPLAAASQPQPVRSLESSPAPSPGASPEPRVSGPISYWELPQSVRDDLPKLHISVLVYAERPEDRFVLVDGQRMGERHEVGGGLVLEEIRRDGAVFSYRKYRFLIKG